MTQTATIQEPVRQSPASPAIKVILAKKMGMTQIFDDKGLARPVTELLAGPCRIVRVKTHEKDGYQALVLGFEDKDRGANEPFSGIFKKVNLEPQRYLREARLNSDGFDTGQLVSLKGMFSVGDYVDVSGVSKGKGFAGGVKRWGFRGGPRTHGQSDRHRAPGSLAGRRSLGRVLPGKKMAGHLGSERVTILKMEVVKVDPDSNRLFVNGGVPGSTGSLVFVRATLKKRKHVVVHEGQRKQSKKKQPASSAKK